MCMLIDIVCCEYNYMYTELNTWVNNVGLTNRGEEQNTNVSAIKIN